MKNCAHSVKTSLPRLYTILVKMRLRLRFSVHFIKHVPHCILSNNRYACLFLCGEHLVLIKIFNIHIVNSNSLFSSGTIFFLSVYYIGRLLCTNVFLGGFHSKSRAVLWKGESLWGDFSDAIAKARWCLQPLPECCCRGSCQTERSWHRGSNSFAILEKKSPVKYQVPVYNASDASLPS